MLIKTIPLRDGRTDVTLTTYVISESPELGGKRKRPAILVCPGGAYMGCSDREAEPVALRFAAMGYHTFVLRYSVYTEGKRDAATGQGAIEPKPHTMHPAPLQDIGMAMLAIHEHADEWLVDTERIALCGFSAGAHNSAMYAVYWNTPMAWQSGIVPKACNPAAVILSYPLTDYVLMREKTKKMEERLQQFLKMHMLVYLGETEPDIATLEMASPARNVNNDTPPMFIWSTAKDALVPIENTYVMAQALAQHGIPCEVHVFEDGEHGLSLADQSSAPYQVFLEPDAAKWVGLAEAWLHKRFALEIPDQSLDF